MARTRKLRRVAGRRSVVACGATLLSALLLTAARPAGAATLDMGGTLEVGMFGVSFTLPQYPSTVPVSVSTGGGAFEDPAGIFYTDGNFFGGGYGGGQIPTPLFTGVPLIAALHFTFTNAGGSFAPGSGGGGGFGGPEPLTGAMIIDVLGLIHVPIDLGVVGRTAGTSLVVAQLSVTVIGQRFTTGQAMVTGITTELTRATPSDTVGCPPVICGLGFGPLGIFANTVTLSGADNRTPGHQGSVWLVSPFSVMTNVTNVPAFLARRATFVPEPGTLVLFVSTAAAAAAVGATRRRRRRDEDD